MVKLPFDDPNGGDMKFVEPNPQSSHSTSGSGANATLCSNDSLERLKIQKRIPEELEIKLINFAK